MKKEIIDIDSQRLCDTIVEGMQENKANDIVVLDLREVVGAVSDFFVICSGDSSTHVDGICKTTHRQVKTECFENPWNTEGKNGSEWILMDYVSVVAHIFQKETRSFFDLEELWADAKKTTIPNLN